MLCVVWELGGTLSCRVQGSRPRWITVLKKSEVYCHTHMSSHTTLRSASPLGELHFSSTCTRPNISLACTLLLEASASFAAPWEARTPDLEVNSLTL